MVGEEEVSLFLAEFQSLKGKHGILFYNRAKNIEALLDLEVSARMREKAIDKLSVKDYYKGPRPDGVNEGAEFWEFGKVVKGQEVYIKLSLGVGDGPVWCLSFHRAERKIKYPFRSKAS